MKSSQEILSEIREKICAAEDQLRFEKKNLYQIGEFIVEEKEKWANEIKAEQLKFLANERELKKKEEKLSGLKAEYEEALKKCVHLEAENENTKKNIDKTKKIRMDQQHNYLIEMRELEKELNKIQDQQKDLKVTNKWAKVFQEKELKAQEMENDIKLKENLRELSIDFAKKMEVFDENLKEIEKSSLKPRQQRLKEAQQTLAQLKDECEVMAKKNQELEKEIGLFKKLPEEQNNTSTF